MIEDALASNAPHIRLLKEPDVRFILGAKPADHKVLFDWVAHTPSTAEHAFTDEHGVHHRFRFLNGAPLNDANFDLEVNFLEYWETTADGKATHFSWVTDIPINGSNLMHLMRGARARCKIENETFNALKNQGYHFEHNCGHGYQHLSTVLMHFIMLAFLIDQIQQRGCRLFQLALGAAKTKSRFWRELRGLFDSFRIPSWERLFQAIIDPLAIELTYETSWDYAYGGSNLISNPSRICAPRKPDHRARFKRRWYFSKRGSSRRPSGAAPRPMVRGP